MGDLELPAGDTRARDRLLQWRMGRPLAGSRVQSLPRYLAARRQHPSDIAFHHADLLDTDTTRRRPLVLRRLQSAVPLRRSHPGTAARRDSDALELRICRPRLGHRLDGDLCDLCPLPSARRLFALTEPGIFASIILHDVTVDFPGYGSHR